MNIHEICKQFVQKYPCKMEKAYNSYYIVNCSIRCVANIVDVVLYSNPLSNNNDMLLKRESTM